jgi:hypothetical protein
MYLGIAGNDGFLNAMTHRSLLFLDWMFQNSRKSSVDQAGTPIAR